MIVQDKEELSGQQIGNYEIVSLVAEHKVSDLFLARDVKLERLVYLEVLSTTVDEDSDLACALPTAHGSRFPDQTPEHCLCHRH